MGFRGTGEEIPWKMVSGRKGRADSIGQAVSRQKSSIKVNYNYYGFNFHTVNTVCDYYESKSPYVTEQALNVKTHVKNPSIES